jgi:type IV pilus assembly protein PilW
MRNFALLRAPGAAQAGFGLIEVLIGMAIGLIAMVAIMQTMVVAESQRRSVTSGADSNTGSVIGSYLIEHDLRMAGYGLTSVSPSGALQVCGFGTVTLFNSARSANPVPTYDGTNPAANAAYVPFTPVSINPSGIPAGDAGTDTLMVNYGGSDGNVSDRATITNPNGDAASLTVTSRIQFHKGDLVLVAAPTGGGTCEVAEITELPGSGQCSAIAGSTNLIGRAAVNFRSFWANSAAGCQTIASRFNGNPSTGLGAGTYDGGRVYNLGPPDKIASRVYAVRNQVLTMCDMVTHDCTAVASVNDAAFWKPIAPGVVMMVAELGKITGYAGNSAPVWTWDKVHPTTLAGWISSAARPDGQLAALGVAAVRLVLVARTDQFEKDEVSFGAATVPDAAGVVTWARDSGGGTRTLSLTGLANWKHYRYKVVEAKVPLRNVTSGRNLIECPIDTTTGGCS